MATSLGDVLVCPISSQLFQDPVVAEDGHTYERQAITEWLRLSGTSPLTRQPLTIGALRPNFIIKKLIDQFETTLQEKKYKFKLNIDVRREQRPLFRTFVKAIYKAEWVDQQRPGPPVIILEIDGARANKVASFYVDLCRHPHIVRTYGLVEDFVPNTSSVMLLQEYASEGSLLKLLKDQTELPAIRILEEMFIQIVDAMVFLASNGIVYGDLACHNVLIFRFDPIEPKRNLVKVADFGLSRFSAIYSSVVDSVSTTTIDIVPAQTAAPEILIENCKEAYSEKSDIFSMGMLMIEALNKGAMPWSHVTDDNEVRKLVIAGNRPPRPSTSHCTDKIWEIISNCLAQSSTKRPTFKELREKLSESENPRSEYPSTNTNAHMEHPYAAVTPNTSFHGNYQQQPYFTTYSPPQYPTIPVYAPFISQNGFFNSIHPAPQYRPNLQINTNNFNYNSNHFQFNNAPHIRVNHRQANTPHIRTTDMNFNPSSTIISHPIRRNPAQSISGNNTTENQSIGQEITQVRNVGSYHAIETSCLFKIILTTDGPGIVTLSSHESHILDSVTTIVERGILKLKMSNNSTNVASSRSPIIMTNNNVNMVNYPSNNSTDTVTAHIGGAHHLTSLIVSGQCNVGSRNTLIIDRFQLILSGSSSFNGSFNVKQLDVTISGCSNVSLNGTADIVMLSISGSSSCYTRRLATKTAQVAINGCSNVLLQGSADTMTLDVSGSSSCAALGFEVKTAQVTASGSSRARVYCTDTLDANIQGSSSIAYGGNAAVINGSPTKIG